MPPDIYYKTLSAFDVLCQKLCKNRKVI